MGKGCKLNSYFRSLVDAWKRLTGVGNQSDTSNLGLVSLTCLKIEVMSLIYLPYFCI